MSKRFLGNINYYIKKAKITHGNKYTYDKVIYCGIDSAIKIICPVHGIFKTTMYYHVNKKHGCPKCSKKISLSENEWLKLMKIPNNKKHRQVKIKINNTIYKADGYDHKTKTIYEFYGDYYHGNPKIYDPLKINGICHKTFGELYQKTIDREKIIKSAGYNLISIWESDFKNVKK